MSTGDSTRYTNQAFRTVAKRTWSVCAWGWNRSVNKLKTRGISLYLCHQLFLKALHHFLVTATAVVDRFYQILHFPADVFYAWTTTDLDIHAVGLWHLRVQRILEKWATNYDFGEQSGLKGILYLPCCSWISILEDVPVDELWCVTSAWGHWEKKTSINRCTM